MPVDSSLDIPERSRGQFHSSKLQLKDKLIIETNFYFFLNLDLLDRDSEMAKAIDDMDSYDEDVTHGQNFTTRAFNSSSKALQATPIPRHHCKSTSNE